MGILQSDWLILPKQHLLYFITWVAIVTSPTNAFANDKFK